MPIYEYQCEQCGETQEALQRFSDNPLTHCKHCSGKLHKLISQSAFHLKGSGWYVTDYSSKAKSAKADSADSKTSDNNASNAESKAEKSTDGKND